MIIINLTRKGSEGIIIYATVIFESKTRMYFSYLDFISLVVNNVDYSKPL